MVDWTLANQPYQAWLGLWWILDFPLRCGSVWWLPGGVPRQQWHVASRRVAIAATWRNKIEGSVESLEILSDERRLCTRRGGGWQLLLEISTSMTDNFRH